jgi:hypothetical protein
MASKANSWCKKLMTKAKARAMKQRYGDELPLYGRKPKTTKDAIVHKRDAFGRVVSTTLEAGHVVDHDDRVEKPFKARVYKPLPKMGTYKSRGDKKIAERKVRGFCAVARDDRLAAQTRALIGALS